MDPAISGGTTTLWPTQVMDNVNADAEWSNGGDDPMKNPIAEYANKREIHPPPGYTAAQWTDITPYGAYPAITATVAGEGAGHTKHSYCVSKTVAIEGAL